MGTADLHIHSIYSLDATTTVRAILKQAADVGLNVIAVTDHDEIRGSFEAQQLAPQYGIEAIPGAEISTKDGHLVALFIKTLPPSGLSISDTLIRIGKQGGIAIAPHPFNNLPNSLSMEAVLGALANPRAKGPLKGIETHNMGTQNFDRVAQKLSVFLPFAKIASSDAHIYWAIGAGRTEFPGTTAQDLRTALEKNTTVPVPYEGESSARAVLSWMRRIAMRKFGYASDTTSASTPINTQQISDSMIRKIQKKQAND
ncbi:MAG: PHP domain-containing protein [Anaerolineales bacterium]|jgi:predicted metal-dependent phosphoesterase TrpH|uniref:PHP domain-containing protein n=1 Tax=Candidatus Villigracilis vicinus TaxID=3140679 RepID=UPI0031371FDD|nr:PHP domain-containing protein [Anaerolineales bacterium]